MLFAPGYDDTRSRRVERQAGNARAARHRAPSPLTRASATTGACIGGLLIQDRDADIDPRESMEVVCGEPTEDDWGELLFAWRVCKHVTSNAIVLARGLQTIGVGAGQMSRVDAVRIAVDKARELGHELQGAALASDAFFPFADGPQLALEAGVRADHPARRLEAGRRGDRGREVSRRGDGLHAPPAFQALSPARPRETRSGACRTGAATLRSG